MAWNEVSSQINQPRKNILNSLLWLSGITFPSGSFAITFGAWPGSLIAFVVGCLPVLASIWYYRHWSNRDPDRLQTEGYRLERDAMTLMGVGKKQVATRLGERELIDNPDKGGAGE